MADKSNPQLARSLNLLDIIAFGITGIIGSGIFLLPGFAAAKMGPASIMAIALAGVICLLIALCFAEVGSRYKTTGAAYLYAQDAFGHFVGFQVGWISCVVSILSWATLAVGFTNVLAYFIPEVSSGWDQKAVAIGIMGGFTVINLFGVRFGTQLNTVLTGAKLIPIALVIGAGIFFIDGGNFEPWAPKGFIDADGGFLEPLATTTFLMIYAYVGFEVLAVPAGEMKNPERNVPFALIVVLLAVMVVYLLLMAVCVGTVPELAGNKDPVGSAATAILGNWGGTMIRVGICLSIFGTTAAMAVFGPRRLYAMGERGDLPRIFARVNPRTQVPTFTAVVFFIAAAVCATFGSFLELAVLSVIARFVQFIPTALAVLVFRARDTQGQKPGFRIPFGPVIPIVTVLACLWLLYAEYDSRPDRLAMGGYALIFVGIPLYWLSHLNRKVEEYGERLAALEARATATAGASIAASEAPARDADADADADDADADADADASDSDE